MKYRLIATESLAIFVSYLVFSLSIASANQVRILNPNGSTFTTATYNPERVTELEITIPSADNQNINIRVDGDIEKMYMYLCKNNNPKDCLQDPSITPQIFNSGIFTRLPWVDVSASNAGSNFPRIANILFIIKLGSDLWTARFAHIRDDGSGPKIYKGTSIIDFYAKDQFINYAKSYIENKALIPFNWSSKVVLQKVNSFYAISGSSQDMEARIFQKSSSSGNSIQTITKDFYFIIPQIDSYLGDVITLYRNPLSTCGSKGCEEDIGENSDICCRDCGCPTGQYCNVNNNIDPGTCKDENAIQLGVVSSTTPMVTQCSDNFEAKVTVNIENMPSGLTLTKRNVKLNETSYIATCTAVSGNPGQYECKFSLNLLRLGIGCGQGSYMYGPGMINLTIKYGATGTEKSLSANFSGLNINYNCGCQEGKYCDMGTHICQSEDAITLGITDLTNSGYLDNYRPGDKIYLRAKIFNPPSGLTVTSMSANMTLNNAQFSPGMPQCSPPDSSFVYNCSIPFQIAGYDKKNSYTFYPNTISFTISYSDGAIQKTKIISAPFGPVSIPSQYCGDGALNPGETPETCCLDAGCPNQEQYCDKLKGCQLKDSVALYVNYLYPSNFTDCRKTHTAHISVGVLNAPADMEIEQYSYYKGDQSKGWSMHCEPSVLGIFHCSLGIPPLESEGCQLPYKVVGPNSLNITISFPDGIHKTVNKQLSTQFENIYITPVYHCGDNVCESDIGEDSSVCCYDCACLNSSYYCDFDSKSYLGGCLKKSDIKLVIDSPEGTVNLPTCESSYYLNIKAHIINQPQNARIEHWYAAVNGTAAEMLHCTREQEFGGSNLSLNCTLGIPKLYKCSYGKTYIYEPNSFSVLLRYNNGHQKEELITLTTQLPKIEVRQGFRTLYDITQEGIRKMKQNLERTMQIARDMMDAIRDCMEMVKTFAYLQLILTIAGGLYGSGLLGKTPQIPFQNQMTSGGFAGAIAGAYWGSTIGKNLMDSYIAMCNFLQAQYQIDIKVQEMEIKMINMEMCMETYQHQMDRGNCDRNPESCFNQITSCVKNGMSEVSSAAADASKIMSNAAAELTKSAGLLGNVANQFGTVTGQIGYGTISIQMRCGERPLRWTGDSCCNVFGSPSPITSSNPIQYECKFKNKLNLIIQNKAANCNTLVTEICEEYGNNCYWYKYGEWSTSVDDLIQKSPSHKCFKFYCYNNENEYNTDTPEGKDKHNIKSSNGDSCYKITLKTDSNPSDDKCECDLKSGIENT